MKNKNRHSATKKQHKQGVAEFFSDSADYWSTIYDEKAGKDIYDHTAVVVRQKRVLEKIKSYVQSSDGIVLEAGCGAGQLLQKLEFEGYPVVGMDFSLSMIKTARSRLQQLKKCIGLVVGDIDYLPFKTAVFSSVISVGVLQYLSDNKRNVNELCRVAIENGIVCVTLPNFFRMTNFTDPYYLLRFFEFVFVKIRKMIMKDEKCFNADDYHKNRNFANRRYFYGHLNSFFKRHGRRLLDSSVIGFGPVTFFRHLLFPVNISLLLSAFLEKISTKKGCNWLKLFGNRWVFIYGTESNRKI